MSNFVLKTSALTLAILALVEQQAFANDYIFVEKFNATGSAVYDATTAGVFSTVGGTKVDVLTPGSAWVSLCTTTLGCVDLNGTGGGGTQAGGQLRSTGISLNPGTYYINYVLYGAGINNKSTTTEIYLGDGTTQLYAQNLTLSASDTTTGVVSAAFTVSSALANAYIQFHSTTLGTDGAKLDAVSISTSSLGSGWEIGGNSVPNIVSANNYSNSNTAGFNLFSNINSLRYYQKFDGGTLKVDNAGSTSSAFSITNNHAYIDQAGRAATFNGVLSNDTGATGKLYILNSGTAGTGKITLGATNTYTGGTEVQAGANLEISSASALGTGTLSLVGTSTVTATISTTTDMTLNNNITVSGDPTFNVAPNTTLTISNPITDGSSAGDVVVDGGGTLLLTAANTYTGSTTINSGSTLQLSGQSASVSTTSSLTNNGIFDLTAAASIISLSGSGVSNFVQSGTGTLKMVGSPTAFQRLNISGTATLNGTLNLNATAGTYSPGRYTLINATGGVTGTFSAFTNNLSSVTALQYSLGYGTNDVYLDLTSSSSLSTADTQDALKQSTSALRSTYNLQTAVVNNSLNYDCTVFAANRVCVSGGGRFATTNSITGDQTSTLLVAAYKTTNNMRVGAFIDQNISTANVTGIAVDKSPMYGVFGVWNENPDAMGYEVRLSTSYANQSITQTRHVVGTSEAGVGSASLTSQAMSGVVSYAMPVTNSTWIASPYVGIRKTKINRSGYTETSAVTAPLTYSDLAQDVTTALAGVRTSKKYSDDLYVTASVGVEQNVSSSISDLNASGVTGLTATDFSANYTKTRPVASVGASYAVAKDQRVSLNVMYRKEAFQSAGSTTALLMYQVGL